MPALTRKDIASSKNLLRVKKLATPEWGNDKTWTHIRMLRADEADLVQRLCFEHAKTKTQSTRIMAGWCVLGICDKNGKRLFTEDDIGLFVSGPLVPLQRTALAIMELNGITGEEDTAKKN